MIKKASAQAKWADNIRVTSEQETEEFVKQIRTEVITAAKKEAEVIKAEAQHRAKMIRESQLDGIKKEVANLAQKLQNDLLLILKA